MKINKGDVLSVQYELLENYEGPDDGWLFKSYRRVGDIKIERRALDLSKPVRFVRTNQLILSIFPSTKPNKYLVEYEDEYGYCLGTVIDCEEIENIPEDEL